MAGSSREGAEVAQPVSSKGAESMDAAKKAILYLIDIFLAELLGPSWSGSGWRGWRCRS